MTQITYSNVDSLRERYADLGKLKDELVTQLQSVLDTNQISKRGTNRIILALSSYPKIPEKKLTDSHEAAAFSLSIQIKEAQLVMLMIATELSNIEKQTSQGDTNG